MIFFSVYYLTTMFYHFLFTQVFFSNLPLFRLLVVYFFFLPYFTLLETSLLFSFSKLKASLHTYSIIFTHILPNSVHFFHRFQSVYLPFHCFALVWSLLIRFLQREILVSFHHYNILPSSFLWHSLREYSSLILIIIG